MMPACGLAPSMWAIRMTILSGASMRRTSLQVAPRFPCVLFKKLHAVPVHRHAVAVAAAHCQGGDRKIRSLAKVPAGDWLACK